MSAENETIIAGPEPDYHQIITEYSWWMSRDGVRRFAVVRISYDIAGDRAVADQVTLLELYHTEPVQLSWAAFIERYNTGKLVKLIRNL